MFRYNVIALLIGIPFLGRVVSYHSTTSESDGFKVASFNTYALGAALKTNTTEEIDLYLDTANISCAALIEWRFQKGKINTENYPYQVKLRTQQNLDNGLLMVSKYPILNSGLVPFSETSYNIAGFMDVEVMGQVIRIYGVHLETTRLKPHHYHGLKSLEFDSLYAENAKNIAQRLRISMQKRAGQVDDLKRHMKNSPHPTIVMGDFNDGSQSYTYQQLKEGKKDAFVEAGYGFESTFLRPFSLLRIDFILFDDEFTCNNYRSTREIYSDHKLIFADLNLK